MEISDATRQEFVTKGFARVDDVISDERTSQVDSVISEIYSGWGKTTDGITSYCHHSGLFELYQEPALERLAQFALATDEVILSSASILFKRPQPDTPPGFLHEHVDAMYSLEDWQQTPRRIMCVVMLAIDDLPLERGNTYVRPGSHMQLAKWLAENDREPMRAHPTPLEKLPDLPWAERVPVVAQRGQAVLFSTNVIHCGSVNTDTEPRRVMFVNFCRKGDLRTRVANHDRREKRTAWRNVLRENFRPDRRHLLDDHED